MGVGCGPGKGGGEVNNRHVTEDRGGGRVWTGEGGGEVNNRHVTENMGGGRVWTGEGGGGG